MTKRTRPRRVKAVTAVAGGDGVEPLRYEWSLPRTAATYDAMVEQMADAWDRQLGYPIRNPSGRHIRIDRVQAMLRAIGITRPKN